MHKGDDVDIFCRIKLPLVQKLLTIVFEINVNERVSLELKMKSEAFTIMTPENSFRHY